MLTWRLDYLMVRNCYPQTHRVQHRLLSIFFDRTRRNFRFKILCPAILVARRLMKLVSRGNYAIMPIIAHYPDLLSLWCHYTAE